MSTHVSMTSHSPPRTTHKAFLLLPPSLPPLASQVQRLGQAWRGTAAALLFMPCAPHLIVLFLALSSICPVSCLLFHFHFHPVHLFCLFFSSPIHFNS